MPHHQKAVRGAEATGLWGSGPGAWQGDPRAPLPGGHKRQNVPYEKGTIARILPEKKFGKRYRQLVLGPRNHTQGAIGNPAPLPAASLRATASLWVTLTRQQSWKEDPQFRGSHGKAVMEERAKSREQSTENKRRTSTSHSR